MKTHFHRCFNYNKLEFDNDWTPQENYYSVDRVKSYFSGSKFVELTSNIFLTNYYVDFEFRQIWVNIVLDESEDIKNFELSNDIMNFIYVYNIN